MSLAGLNVSNGFLGNSVVSCTTTAGLASRDRGKCQFLNLIWRNIILYQTEELGIDNRQQTLAGGQKSASNSFTSSVVWIIEEFISTLQLFSQVVTYYFIKQIHTIIINLAVAHFQCFYTFSLSSSGSVTRAQTGVRKLDAGVFWSVACFNGDYKWWLKFKLSFSYLIVTSIKSKLTFLL